MRRQRFVGVVSVFVGLLLTTPAASAQALASSTADAKAFSNLEVRLGDTLIVKTRDTPRVRGTLLSLTNDQLTLAVDGSARTLLAADVQEVKRKRFGVRLGPIIGAGAGFALGLVAASDAPGPGFTGEQDLATPAVIFATLLGAGIGLGIDAAINIPRTVYQRELRVRVTPVVTHTATGINVLVAF